MTEYLIMLIVALSPSQGMTWSGAMRLHFFKRFFVLQLKKTRGALAGLFI